MLALDYKEFSDRVSSEETRVHHAWPLAARTQQAESHAASGVGGRPRRFERAHNRGPFALLGAMAMVMITGQKGILSHKQALFQVVDIVSTMAPLTKMARQIVSAATIPSIVREAFRLAQQERLGSGAS